MKLPHEKTEVAIAEMLRANLPELQRLGFGRWSSVSASGTAQVVTVRIVDDEWLVMDAFLRETNTPAGLWEYLQLNANLGGPSKVVLAGDNRSLRLRAEILLNEEIDLESRLCQTCAGFEAGVSALGGPVLPGELIPLQAHAAPCDLPTLCAESGWAWSQRSGVVLVELHEGRAFRQATLRADANGAVRVHVDLVSCGFWPSESRWALAMLLLSASRAVRLACGFVHEADGMQKAGFQVRFGTTPTAIELTQALAALSAACGLASQEAEVLEGLSVARAYLGLRSGSGWFQEEQVTSPKEQSNG